MASANYVLLERITVGAAGASSVTFSGIPQTGYTDLVVKLSGREGGNNWTLITFNGDTGNNYYQRSIHGQNGSASSNNYGPRANIYDFIVNSSGDTANTFCSTDIYIPNYTSSNQKSLSLDSAYEGNSTTLPLLGLIAGLWTGTAAITSITLATGNAWAANSTFYLYGVAKLGTTPAIVPYATGGDTIMTDGTYWYHAFISDRKSTRLNSSHR
jgi:hypothetical protein